MTIEEAFSEQIRNHINGCGLVYYRTMNGTYCYQVIDGNFSWFNDVEVTEVKDGIPYLRKRPK